MVKITFNFVFVNVGFLVNFPQLMIWCSMPFFISECPALSQNFEGYVIVQRSKTSTSFDWRPI